MKEIPRFIPALTVKNIRSALYTVGADSLIDFAKQFAEYIGSSFAIPAPSARVALKGILHALDLPRGGQVILPSLVFHCIPEIFLEHGLQPRFVDIDPRTYGIDVDKIESALTSSTVAIFPVHLYGRACDMKRIKEIARKYNLIIIEDCAQACGVLFSEKRAGSFGQAAIFSFSAHKNLSALGMGMAVTGSYELAVKISSWMEQMPCMGNIALAKAVFYAAGIHLVTQPWFWNPIMTPALKFFDLWGIDLIEALTNERPGTHKVGRTAFSMPRRLHGRIGLSQLPRLDSRNQERVRKGDTLLEYLQGTPGVELPAPAVPGENIYSSFVIRVKNRRMFRSRLRKSGVDTHGGNMSIGPHLMGDNGSMQAKNAFDAVTRMVHLPMYPALRDSDLRNIAKAVKAASQEW